MNSVNEFTLFMQRYEIAAEIKNSGGELGDLKIIITFTR